MMGSVSSFVLSSFSGGNLGLSRNTHRSHIGWVWLNKTMDMNYVMLGKFFKCFKRFIISFKWLECTVIHSSSAIIYQYCQVSICLYLCVCVCLSGEGGN